MEVYLRSFSSVHSVLLYSFYTFLSPSDSSILGFYTVLSGKQLLATPITVTSTIHPYVPAGLRFMACLTLRIKAILVDQHIRTNEDETE